MNSSKLIDVSISKSSLVGLKAELLKKQEEVKQIKEKQQDPNVDVVSKQKKNVQPKKLKAKIKKQRFESNDCSEDDSDILKKSREVLEVKSRLYDKLQESCANEEATKPHYLIDFLMKQEVNQQQKSMYSAVVENAKTTAGDSENDELDITDSSDDWVDYVDSLGRSRRCLRTDFQEMKEKDSALEKYLKPPSPPPCKEVTPELLSWDMQREIMRKKWEEQEVMLLNKQDIHYQDVLFDEARARGVGYFEFSSDEAERIKQQNALKHLREKTLEQQEATQGLRARRQQQLQLRLAAARRRRRERLGLPPEDPELLVNDNSICDDDKEDPVEELKVKDIEEQIKRIAPVRPWDIGKQGVQLVLTQEEWVEKKRQERPEEFAPPLSMQNKMESRGSSLLNHSRPKEISKDKVVLNVQNDLEPKSCFVKSVEKAKESQVEFLKCYKPTVEDIDNFLLRQKEKHLINPQLDLKSTENKTIRSQKTKIGSKFPSEKRSVDNEKNSESRIQQQSFKGCNDESNFIEEGSSAHTHKQLANVRFLNVDEKPLKSDNIESYTDTLSSSDYSHSQKRKWAEIAPPSAMSYYNSCNSFSNSCNSFSKIAMDESVSAGLDHLKTLSKEKEQKKVRGLLDLT